MKRRTLAIAAWACLWISATCTAQTTVEVSGTLEVDALPAGLAPGGSIDLKRTGGKLTLCAFPAPAPTPAPPPSGEKRVLKWADINAKFDHAFIPGPDSYNPWTYTLGGHTQLASGNLLMMGHQYYTKAHEMDLQGNPVGEFINVANWNDPDKKLDRTCDILQIGKDIHSVSQQWYNADASDIPGFEIVRGAAATEPVRKGPISAPVRTAGVNAKYSAGWMNEPGPFFAAEGYSFLCADQGSAGAAVCRYGPNLNVSKVTPGRDYPTKVLMQHSETQPFPTWSIGDQLSSLVWIETADSWAVLGIAYRAISPTVYTGYFHADTWEIRAMIWDPQDIIDVYRGLKPTNGLLPVEEFVLVDKDHVKHSVLDVDWVATDRPTKMMLSFKGKRLVVVCPGFKLVKYDLLPKIWVFEF